MLFSDKYGLKESMVGKIDIKDIRLKELPKRIHYIETAHMLKLFQKDWKIEFQLSLIKDVENEYRDNAELSFDDSLKKEVYNHFKEFMPIEIK